MTAPKQWQSVMAHLDGETDNITADVETIITDLMSHTDLIQWIIGDTLLKVGTSKANLDHFTKIARCSESALRSYVTTCKVWQPDIRWQLLDKFKTPDGDPVLSFAMFKECNSLASQFDMATAIETIERAGRDLMTVKELRHYIATELKDNDPSPRYEKLGEGILRVELVPFPSYEYYHYYEVTIDGISFENFSDLPIDLESERNYRIVIYEIKDTD